MELRQITCDGCSRDLTKTGNSIDWRIVLDNQKIPSHEGAVTDMWLEPSLKRSHHFCGLTCLRIWMANK